MNFLSVQYATLLLFTWAVYWSLPWRRVRILLLLAASYLFYMSWNPRLVVLIVISTLIDYLAGSGIAAAATPAAKKRWLWLSLGGNLGILAVFKYYGFFVDSAVVLLNAVGFAAPQRTLELMLPLGISFYTFQSLSYTIDVYYGRLRPTKSLLEFATFVAFFPQLVAGPIVRARDFLPQLAGHRALKAADVQAGIDRIVIGLVKKGVFADNFATISDRLYTQAYGGTSATHAWMAALTFYCQVYCDFSAYSDLAIGSARLFGFRLKENFTRPYLTTSPQAYWQHWHISLSTWFRDYIYFPLGGNRKGPVRTYLNLFAIMLVSGLWHGAAWTFVIWGAYHGAWLLAHRAWSRRGGRFPHALGLVGQVFFTTVGYFMFRAESWTHMSDLFRSAFTGPLEMLTPAEQWVFLWAAIGLTLESSASRLGALCALPTLGPLFHGALWALGIHALLIAGAPDVQGFIYFVF